MRKLFVPIAISAAAMAGCASYSGSGLVPGKATAAEVEALMGRPAERVEHAGETILWYPRGPMGYHSYAVRIGPDGILREIDQRLTVENVGKLAPGSSTRQDARDLFGPPFIVSYMPRQKREVWEYQLLEGALRWKLWVQFSDDGVLREVVKLRDPYLDLPGPGRS